MSHSPRRKAISDLRFERNKLARRKAEYDVELRSARDAYQAELRYLREKFAPRLDKLASVTVGTPLRVPYINESYAPRYYEIGEIPDSPPIYRVETISTEQNYAVVIRIAPETIRFALLDHEETAIREIAERVRAVVVHAIRVEIFGYRPAFPSRSASAR